MLLPARTLRILLTCFCSIFILALPLSSGAEISLTFVPIEEAKFLIRGTGWESTVSVALAVDYDTTYLSSPQVTVMGGELLEVHLLDQPPGQLQLGILNNRQSPVFEACIFFQKQGEHPGVINFVTAEITPLAGARRPVPVAIMPNPNTPTAPDYNDNGAASGTLQTTWGERK